MTGGDPSILAVMVGSLIGLSLGTTGSGGSLIAIPLLVYVFGAGAQEAVSLSLALVAVAAYIGAIESFQSGLVKGKAAFLLSGTGMIGGWIGVAGHRHVREEVLLLLFGVLMIVAEGQMWWRTTLRDDPQERSLCADLLAESERDRNGGRPADWILRGGRRVCHCAGPDAATRISDASGGGDFAVDHHAHCAGGARCTDQCGSVGCGILSFLIAGAVIGMLAGRQVSRALSPMLLTRAFAVVAWVVAGILIGHNLWKINGGIL